MTRIDLRPRIARDALGDLVEPADDADTVRAYARAMWSVLTEPGDGVAGALIAAFGPEQALEIAIGGRGDAAIGEAFGIAAAALAAGRARWSPRRDDTTAMLATARHTGVRLLTPEDQDWPSRVDDLGVHAPLCLWARGDLRHVTGDTGLALVGARAASAYGEHVAAELAAECAAVGVGIISGAAYGIDGAAHRGALSVGGSTVAVMAGGVERPYPAGHRDLVERIVRQGVVVAEVPCGSSPTKWRFLARNRLIAALSDATIVVEAGWRSGSLNTAHHAAQLGRPLGAVPGPVTSATSAGSHRLLREMDAVCITSAADVRELLGIEAPEIVMAGGYTGERTRILDAVTTRSARHTADIARRAGFAVTDAATLLALLELEGAVRREEDGWRRVAPSR